MKKISGILLLVGMLMSYSCKKDKEEKEEEIPAKPGKFTMNDKSFDLDLGYYFYSKDPDSDQVAYQITFSNKNVFSFSTNGEITDVNIVSFSIIVDDTNTFSEGTFEYDKLVSDDQKLYEMGSFGHGCTATLGHIGEGENGNLHYEMDMGKVTLKKTGDKHVISFELEMDADTKISGSFSGVLTKTDTPVSN